MTHHESSLESRSYVRQENSRKISKSLLMYLLFIFLQTNLHVFFFNMFSRERNLVMNDSWEDLMIFFVIIRLKFSEFSVGQVKKSNVQVGNFIIGNFITEGVIKDHHLRNLF